MIILSFDVGFLHLGWVLLEVGPQFNIRVLTVECVDITNLKHHLVPLENCRLPHTNHVCDRMEHFFAEYEPLWQQFGTLDEVFLERQPLGSPVEALLYARYRDRALLISPNSMHKYFCIDHLDYEHRKHETERIATPYLQAFEAFSKLERKHDIADAFVLAYFEIQKRKKKQERLERLKASQNRFKRKMGESVDVYFNKFRFGAPRLRSNE